MGEFWEPWAPATGARVRIRLSGECEHDPAWLDGLPGTVIEVIEPGEWASYLSFRDCEPVHIDVRGHRFAVVPDHPANARGCFCWLAAIELEPLDP
jgi:hypothetical protein